MKRLLLKTGLIIMSGVCLLVPLASCGKNVRQWTAPPTMQIDTSKTYYATFNTSLGTFKVELWAKDAPITVNNFVFLAEQKFYDGTVFHRIIKNFMIQGGDPDHNNPDIGGPGYTFNDELPVKGKYDPGVLAMANSGANTNGSQFFICTGANASSYLDANSNYTQFGRVVEGMDAVIEIASVEVGIVFIPALELLEFSKPKNPPVIHSITIEVI